MGINKELSERELLQRENDINHSPYGEEFEFYSAVRSGDMELVNKLYNPLDAAGHGKLCDDELQNLKYHLVITIAMISRFCIEGGMPLEKAYTISDIYINKCDKCRTAEKVTELHKEVIEYYTKESKKIASENAYSKHILMCIDYVYDNIYSGVTVQDAAAELGLTPQYLSKLFKQEVGINLSDFIMNKRITAAENMLRYSEYTPLDIGNYLCFSSQSHFISCFKKKTGLTPRKYREYYFRMNWGNVKDGD